MRAYLSIICLLFFIIQHCLSSATTNYYDLLGIKKSASNKDIRRAFKGLALKLHPDKHPDDQLAHDGFLKLTRAYEVLKDDELRKKYDMYGEEGLKDDQLKNQYESWNFYNQDFGLYDEDVEIETIEDWSVIENSDEVWFVNFYSSLCSHCRILAPTWKRFAKEMEGILRIGAVNCMDNFLMCRQLRITGYPTLKIFPGNTEYLGSREFDDISQFSAKYIDSTVEKIHEGNIAVFLSVAAKSQLPYLISFCFNPENCVSGQTMLRLAAKFKGMVNVAEVLCSLSPRICRESFAESYYDELVFFEGQSFYRPGIKLDSLDILELSQEIMHFLPLTKWINDRDFLLMKDIYKNLVIYYTNTDNEDYHLDLQVSWGLVGPIIIRDVHEVQKLSLRLSVDHYVIMRIACDTSALHCKRFNVAKTPLVALHKRDGKYELHVGSMITQEVVKFVHDAASCSNTVLDSSDFPIPSSDQYFVDFFTPWCPPCQKMLPEWRKASSFMQNLKFGLVDCTIHARICHKYRVVSYPTAIFFNGTSTHTISGSHSAEELIEFAQDIIKPSSIILNSETYAARVERANDDSKWLVEFYAPWCGYCKQLEPEWKKVALQLHSRGQIFVAKVDCSTNERLCQRQAISGYPTIRYVSGGKSIDYNGNSRDANTIIHWAFNQLPKVSCGVVDCQVSRTLCTNLKIHEYPTFRLFYGHSTSNTRHPGETLRITSMGEISGYIRGKMAAIRDEL